jgi:cysteine desulfurase
MAVFDDAGTYYRALIANEGEHASVRENMAALEKCGLATLHAALDREGRLGLDSFKQVLSLAVRKETVPRFVAVMAVNNETGSLSDIPSLVQAARTVAVQEDWAPLHFHSDCVQALGKIPLGPVLEAVDSAAFSAHKLGGPRGIGLLYLKKPLEPLVRGGGQEQGLRPGTENTAGALAFAACMERYAQADTIKEENEKAAARMERLVGKLQEMPRCMLIPEDRQARDSRFSPWILQASFNGIPGEVMARCLDDAGFAVGTGSACSSRETRRPVLEAMGVDSDRAFEGIRISQGWTTTDDDIDALAAALKEILCRL